MKTAPLSFWHDASLVSQPSGVTTHVSWLAVEISTRTSCAGVPTRRVKVDHGPSGPSLQRKVNYYTSCGFSTHVPVLGRRE